MTLKGKPIICIDFDGVIHSYERGWHGGDYPGHIYGDVRPGFFEWAAKAKETFKLVIYSSRSKEMKGRQDMAEWLTKQSITSRVDADVLAWFEFTHEKPPAFITIDDRAVCFNGDWRQLDLQPENLIEFKPWMDRLKPE